MNFNNKDPDVWKSVLEELIFVGILVVISLLIFSPGLILAVALNLCALLLMYRLARARQKHRMRKRLNAISAIIRAISEDITMKISIRKGEDGLEQFYTEVESLRAMLAEKESDRQSMMQVLNTIATNIELEKMLEDIMPLVVEATRSICSAFYLINPVTDMLEIKHSIGFGKNLYAQFDQKLGEGIMGQTANSREIRVLRDIPEDTVYLARTFLGTLKPRNIMVVPIVNQDHMLGVLMLASVYDYTQDHIDNMGLMRYYLGVAVHNGVSYEKNKRLTNELKFQNKLIQDLNADLERKVRDRTTFLNDVIDSIKDYAIYALDTNGVIVAWNSGAENLLELKAADVIGKHVEVIYKEDPDRIEKMQRSIDAALREGRYSESGWRQKSGGTSCYFEMTLFARYSQMGEVVGFTSVTRDMTAYKKASAELGAEKEFSAKIIETSPYALLLLDSDASIKVANSAARELFSILDTRRFYNCCKNESDIRGRFSAILETSKPESFIITLRNGDPVQASVSLIKDSSSMVKMLLIKADNNK